MSDWYDRLRFLWEEEIAPPEEVPRGDRQGPVACEESTGVPRPLRRATRFALLGVVATTLIAQIIGVRLVAPVDAAPTHPATCAKQCQAQGLTGQALAACIRACRSGP